VWHVPDGLPSAELYGRLRTVVTDSAADFPRVAIADSKALYHSGKGLRLLERGLWAACGLLGRQPRTCAEVWDWLAPGSADDRRAAMCDGCDDAPLPGEADCDELERLRPALSQALADAEIQLVSLESRAVFPEEFNRTVEQCGSKGLALSRWTLGLVARAMAVLGATAGLPSSAGSTVGQANRGAPAPAGPLRHAAPVTFSVVCDKHGGRDRYGSVLTECFPDVLVEVHGEGRQRSVYRFGPPERRTEICFQARAESHLAAALASMASKYLRELAVRALNLFWHERLPGLRPTAGYPQDARRFKAEITPLQRRLAIDDRVIWRAK
jgi:hypothetical protein